LADLEALAKVLGVSFNDPPLLEQALLHRSYVNENPALARTSNERLEFLGDAVLGLVVAEKLFQDFPDLSEGEMTRLRAAVVCREALGRIARNLGLGSYLYLGRGEEASGGRRKAGNLSRVLEAVIGAISLDQGMAVAGDFIRRVFGEELEKAYRRGAAVDYKSQLQELIQARGRSLPAYCVVEASGPQHQQHFTVEVREGEVVLGSGSGRSKKEAETEAARSALERLSRDFTQ